MTNKFFDFVDDIPDDIVEVKKETKKIKSMNLFDHIKSITQKEYDPTYFDNLSENDKKTFSTYMINRYLSMNNDWISIVNYFQQYTQVISSKETYKFYSSLIPTSNVYLKYIKGKNEGKYNKELINLMVKYYEISINEATEYLDIFYIITGGKDDLIKICKLYGKTEKEIKKLLKK